MDTPLFNHLVGARASTDCGMVKPSALAVLRLITVSYLVEDCTGRSAGFLALEDTIDVACRLTELVDEIRPIGDQATGGDKVAGGVDCGQSVPGS